ncbi:putative ribonuclease H-like domain-containing protein [Tanacetum coccineum]
MDVKSAFLYGTIEEEVYVCQPPGFEDPQFPDKVYKVEKALYGLHQAPRAWYETLSTYLLENGFRRGTIDKTLFIKKDKGDILLVQVYVDYIIFGSTKKSLCVEFEHMMHKRFQMSSMGELTFFLGLQVKQKDDGIFISQEKYVADILKKFDFATMKTTSTPIETNKALLKDEEVEDMDVYLYRSMIGSLMYLTASRPDIMFAVCACARFQVTPKVSHLHAVKRIFRYLKGQPKLGLWYPRDSPFDLEAFSNSDYAGASLDRKSTTGGQVCDNKCRVTLSEHDSEITKDGKVIGRGIRKKGLYVMKLGNKLEDKICLATIDENSTLWHKRLGHANMRLIQSLASKELVRNLPKLKFDQHFYDACTIGKQAYASHKAKNIVSMTKCLELLHMDLFGPSAIQSYSQNSKAYLILNKHTRKVEESLNVTFDETPPPSKTSPLVDDDLDEEEAIKVTEKKNLENDIVDETLEIDKIVNIKESRNNPLENVIGNLNQRTLRSQAQNQSNFFCFISTIEPKNVNDALMDDSWIETDIRQKDEKRSQNDKTEHGMEEREKVKVKSQSQSQTREVKVKAKAVNEEILNGPTRTHLMGQRTRFLDGYDDFGTSTHTRNTPAEALTEQAQQVNDQDLELLV